MASFVRLNELFTSRLLHRVLFNVLRPVAALASDNVSTNHVCTPLAEALHLLRLCVEYRKRHAPSSPPSPAAPTPTSNSPMPDVAAVEVEWPFIACERSDDVGGAFYPSDDIATNSRVALYKGECLLHSLVAIAGCPNLHLFQGEASAILTILTSLGSDVEAAVHRIRHPPPAKNASGVDADPDSGDPPTTDDAANDLVQKEERKKRAQAARARVMAQFAAKQRAFVDEIDEDDDDDDSDNNKDGDDAAADSVNGGASLSSDPADDSTDSRGFVRLPGNRFAVGRVHSPLISSHSAASHGTCVHCHESGSLESPLGAMALVQCTDLAAQETSTLPQRRADVVRNYRRTRFFRDGDESEESSPSAASSTPSSVAGDGGLGVGANTPPVVAVSAATRRENEEKEREERSDSRGDGVTEVGLHVSHCGHFMHSDCHERFHASLLQAYADRTPYEGQGKIFLENAEFLCPACKTLCNSLTPVTFIPVHAVWDLYTRDMEASNSLTVGAASTADASAATSTLATVHRQVPRRVSPVLPLLNVFQHYTKAAVAYTYNSSGVDPISTTITSCGPCRHTLDSVDAAKLVSLDDGMCHSHTTEQLSDEVRRATGALVHRMVWLMMLRNVDKADPKPKPSSSSTTSPSKIEALRHHYNFHHRRRNGGLLLVCSAVADTLACEEIRLRPVVRKGRPAVIPLRGAVGDDENTYTNAAWSPLLTSAKGAKGPRGVSVLMWRTARGVLPAMLNGGGLGPSSRSDDGVSIEERAVDDAHACHVLRDTLRSTRTLFSAMMTHACTMRRPAMELELHDLMCAMFPLEVLARTTSLSSSPSPSPSSCPSASSPSLPVSSTSNSPPSSSSSSSWSRSFAPVPAGGSFPLESRIHLYSFLPEWQEFTGKLRPKQSVKESSGGSRPTRSFFAEGLNLPPLVSDSEDSEGDDYSDLDLDDSLSDDLPEMMSDSDNDNDDDNDDDDDDDDDDDGASPPPLVEDDGDSTVLYPELVSDSDEEDGISGGGIEGGGGGPGGEGGGSTAAHVASTGVSSDEDELPALPPLVNDSDCDGDSSDESDDSDLPPLEADDDDSSEDEEWEGCPGLLDGSSEDENEIESDDGALPPLIGSSSSEDDVPGLHDDSESDMDGDQDSDDDDADDDDDDDDDDLVFGLDALSHYMIPPWMGDAVDGADDDDDDDPYDDDDDDYYGPDYSYPDEYDSEDVDPLPFNVAGPLAIPGAGVGVGPGGVDWNMHVAAFLNDVIDQFGDGALETVNIEALVNPPAHQVVAPPQHHQHQHQPHDPNDPLHGINPASNNSAVAAAAAGTSGIGAGGKKRGRRMKRRSGEFSSTDTVDWSRPKRTTHRFTTGELLCGLASPNDVTGKADPAHAPTPKRNDGVSQPSSSFASLASSSTPSASSSTPSPPQHRVSASDVARSVLSPSSLRMRASSDIALTLSQQLVLEDAEVGDDDIGMSIDAVPAVSPSTPTPTDPMPHTKCQGENASSSDADAAFQAEEQLIAKLAETRDLKRKPTPLLQIPAHEGLVTFVMLAGVFSCRTEQSRSQVKHKEPVSGTSSTHRATAATAEGDTERAADAVPSLDRDLFRSAVHTFLVVAMVQATMQSPQNYHSFLRPRSAHTRPSVGCFRTDDDDESEEERSALAGLTSRVLRAMDSIASPAATSRPTASRTSTSTPVTAPTTTKTTTTRTRSPPPGSSPLRGRRTGASPISIPSSPSSSFASPSSRHISVAAPIPAQSPSTFYAVSFGSPKRPSSMPLHGSSPNPLSRSSGTVPIGQDTPSAPERPSPSDAEDESLLDKFKRAGLPPAWARDVMAPLGIDICAVKALCVPFLRRASLLQALLFGVIPSVSAVVPSASGRKLTSQLVPSQSVQEDNETSMFLPSRYAPFLAPTTNSTTTTTTTTTTTFSSLSSSSSSFNDGGCVAPIPRPPPLPGVSSSDEPPSSSASSPPPPPLSPPSETDINVAEFMALTHSLGLPTSLHEILESLPSSSSSLPLTTTSSDTDDVTDSGIGGGDGGLAVETLVEHWLADWIAHSSVSTVQRFSRSTDEEKRWTIDITSHARRVRVSATNGEVPEVDALGPLFTLPCELVPRTSGASPFAAIEFPKVYDLMFQDYLNRECDQCGMMPKDPCVCLVCGMLLCAGVTKTTELGDQIGECTIHSRLCGAGHSIFLLVKRGLLLKVSDGMFSLAEPPYLDAHHEADPGLARGRALYLNEHLHEHLLDQFVGHALAKRENHLAKYPRGFF